MATIAIIGDGPGGLSAALFIARAGHDVTVYGADQTIMHYAFLNNYLGADARGGTDFQTASTVALNAGAAISEERYRCTITGGGVEVTTETGNAPAVSLYFRGKQMPLANSLGIQTPDGEDEIVPVDRNGKQLLMPSTSLLKCPATRSQAIISAGDV